MLEIAETGPAPEAADPTPRDEGGLWPWIGRFLWSPAADLHPSRRESLLPGWPSEAWSDAAVLSHVSRHVLNTQGLLGQVEWSSAAGEFRVALLPQVPLAHLARCVGLALHGAGCRANPAIDEAERQFVERRVPLYWRAPPAEGDDPGATGWQALRVLVSGQAEGVARRFEWKTPLGPGRPAALPERDILLKLVQKILKEFEQPWSSLFAKLRQPDHQIRLHA